MKRNNIDVRSKGITKVSCDKRSGTSGHKNKYQDGFDMTLGEYTSPNADYRQKIIEEIR